MKGLISYSSNTGNTEKLAQTIYDVLKDEYDVELKNVKDVKDTSDYDFVLHGIWVRMTGLDNRSKKFLKKLPKGTRLGIFGTSGGEHATEHSERLDQNLKEAEAGFDMIGTKLTFGKVSDDIISKMDGIIGNLVPAHVKKWIKEMSLKSREATDAERREVAEYFKARL